MSKTIFLYNLWKIVGWKGLCIYVEELFFFVKNKFLMNFYPNQWKTKPLYILPNLANCHFDIASFYLWMSKVGHDIFTLMINFVGVD